MVADAPVTVRLRLPRYHLKQAAVADHPARFRVLACGRRWGKSLLAIGSALEHAARPGAVVWYVAPTFPMVDLHWRTLLTMLPPGFPATAHQQSRRLDLPNGASIQFKSGDNPDSLRGAGLDFAVLDEAAFMSGSVWEEAIRPALSDRRGRALIISTPRGHNWFSALWHRGQGQDEAYAAFRYPSASNPYLPAGEVGEAQSQLPEAVFRQEYEAEFLASGAVFRYVDEAVRQPDGRPGPVVVGVDWGKRDDFTVAIAYDTSRRAVVGIERINQLDYTVQISRVGAFVREHGAALMLAETNGVGEPLCDLAMQAGLPLRRFDTSAQSKARIIGELVSAFDHRRICLPDDETLLGELRAFTMTASSTGGVKYTAPPGMHDDCVMALAFALEAAMHAGREVALWV